MDLSSVFAEDYLAWDDTEAVGYESTRRGQAAQDAVPVAHRRNLTGRELLASGGVYTGDDQVWLLPAALLTPGLVPKPADVVTDGDGRRWTVLGADLGKYRSTWKLTCRDLVLAHDLQDTVDVERATLSYDLAGAAVKVFPPGGGSVLYAGVQARVQQTGEEVREERGIRGPVKKYDVVVGRQVPLLSTEDRVKWADRDTQQVVYLDVLRLRQAQQIDQLSVIECEAKP